MRFLQRVKFHPPLLERLALLVKLGNMAGRILPALVIVNTKNRVDFHPRFYCRAGPHVPPKGDGPNRVKAVK
jgi:hypothetical protein